MQALPASSNKLNSFMGKRVVVQCGPYAYSARLSEIKGDWVRLEEVSVVEEKQAVRQRQNTGKAGRPPQVAELDILNSFVLYPDESLNARSKTLGMARQSLVERLKRMAKRVPAPVRQEGFEWVLLEAGRRQ